MVDRISKETRSKLMSKIKSNDTKPEMLIRRELWKRGWRYQIHPKNIKGKPDLFFKKFSLAIFIDGCFWHKCPKCFKMPKSNIEYWEKKIEKNTQRDANLNSELYKMGIKVIRFWEHEVLDNILDVLGKIERELYLLSNTDGEPLSSL